MVGKVSVAHRIVLNVLLTHRKLCVQKPSEDFKGYIASILREEEQSGV